MQKIILIVGTSHSGSTVLSLMLGCHPQLGAVGELARTYYADTLSAAAPICSCGEAVQSCIFWGPVARALAGAPAHSLGAFYRAATERFAKLYGAGLVPVDSSKSLRALRMLAGANDYDLRVIFLVKDVRNYTVSMRDKYGGSALRHFLYWGKKNRRIRRELMALSIPYFLLGYEQLCFATTPVLQRLCAFVDIGMDAAMPDPANSRHHILEGNRMSADWAEPHRIQYDSRWLQRRQGMLAALCLPHIMRLNNELVYSEQPGTP